MHSTQLCFLNLICWTIFQKTCIDAEWDFNYNDTFLSFIENDI